MNSPVTNDALIPLVSDRRGGTQSRPEPHGPHSEDRGELHAMMLADGMPDALAIVVLESLKSTNRVVVGPLERVLQSCEKVLAAAARRIHTWV